MADDHMTELKVGNTIPHFEGVDEEGNHVSSKDLHGIKAVLYFYPKDDTPGCTKEACGFRDSMDELDSKEFIVIGISPDSSASHRKFIEKYELNFCLLSDPQLSIAKKFGAVKPKEDGSYSIERSTYIIDEAGVIRWMEKPVKVDGHTQRVLQAVDSI